MSSMSTSTTHKHPKAPAHVAASLKPVALARGDRESKSTDPLLAALALIGATSVEAKSSPSEIRTGAPAVRTVLDPGALAMARSMFPAGKIYYFDLFASTSIGSTGLGAMTGTLSISPAVVSYAEWPALSALFDEVCLVRAAVNLRPQVGADGQDLNSTTAQKSIVNGFLMGANLNNISTAPASYTAVGRLARSAEMTRTISDRGASSLYMYAPEGRPWADTTTPAVQSPPAGMLGAFDYSVSAAVTNSRTYYIADLRVTVALRVRQ